MTRSTRIYGKVALLMAGILAASVLLTLAVGVDRRPAGKTRIVASFYPVYIAALNLADGVEGVEVVSLTGPTTGCLHDYQLSPDNRITLSGASVLAVNGAGAESFLDGVLAQSPDLPVVDTSAGVPLIESGEHHEHEGHDHSEQEEVFYNEHIWTSPERYRRQVENLRDGLCRHDPAHAKQYEENAAAYIRQIEVIGGRLKAAAASLPFKTCVTFHDSLSYMAADWGLTVAASLSIGEESGVSAADLAQAEQQAKAAGQILLLYDSQYPVEYAYVGASARESRVLALRTGVSGDPVPSAWLDAMTYNLSLLEELSGAKGGDGA